MILAVQAHDTPVQIYAKQLPTNNGPDTRETSCRFRSLLCKNGELEVRRCFVCRSLAFMGHCSRGVFAAYLLGSDTRGIRSSKRIFITKEISRIKDINAACWIIKTHPVMLGERGNSRRTWIARSFGSLHGLAFTYLKEVSLFYDVYWLPLLRR